MEIDTMLKSQVQQNSNYDDTSVYNEPLSENIYKFCDNAYYSQSGFRDGTYLTPYSREMFYTGRRQISTYKNFIGPILNATVQPIFQDEIARTFPENTLFEKFESDADYTGTPLQTVVQEAMNLVVRQGQAFLVMDNFPKETQPTNKQEAIQNRVLPYVMIKSALDIEDYSLDKFGNIKFITFYDEKIKEGKDIIQTYRMWDSQASYILKKVGTKFEQIGEPIIHGLNEVPVIPAYRLPRTNKKCLLIDPPSYDLCRVALSIYNKESEARSLERDQAFSLLVIQGKPSNLNVGSKNILFVPSEATIAPSYISPNPQIQVTLMISIEKTVEDLFKLAEQSGVTAVRSQTSGITEAYKFFGHETVLRTVSQIAKQLEENIVKLFSLYTTEDLSMYTCDYPTEFSPLNTAAEVDEIDKYMKMNPPPLAMSMAMQKVTRMVLADQDPILLDAACEQIQQEATQEEATQEEKIEEEIE